MPLILLLLGLTLGVGFLMLLTSLGRRGQPFHFDSATQTTHFRHTRLLRVFAVLVFFGAEFLFGVWLILYPPQTRAGTFVTVGMAIVLGLLGLLLIWEAYRFALLVSPTKLECRSPWKAPKSFAWNQVTRLDYSRANSWFIVSFASGDSFRISTVVPGVTEFLVACERHLSAEQLAGAERGYAAVGRPWPHSPSTPKPIRWNRWLIGVTLVFVVLFGVLFVVNGVWLANGETPVVGQFVDVTPTSMVSTSGEVRILANNVAKGFAQRSGLVFNSREVVEAKLTRMGDAIREQKPDLVFLSEVMTECDPVGVNQLEFLAKKCGLPYYAFGENYNFGLPFYRVVGGNAILSRKPLQAVSPTSNLSLSGRQPFYITKNSRRALFATIDIAKQHLLLGSLHNDSYDIRNNAGQVRQILDFIGDRQCVLAGDFNATPDSEPMKMLSESQKFTGEWSGEPTFPEKSIRIDYVFGPAAWKHVSTKVIPYDASDHRPVLAIFKLEK